MPGGLGVVDFVKLATLHGALSATGHAVHGDAVFGKKLIEIDVLATRENGQFRDWVFVINSSNNYALRERKQCKTI